MSNDLVEVLVKLAGEVPALVVVAFLVRDVNKTIGAQLAGLRADVRLLLAGRK